MDKKSITDNELRELLRKACKKAGSQKKWAEDNGFSPAYVNDLLKGNRKLTDKVGEVFGRKFEGRWILNGKQ